MLEPSPTDPLASSVRAMRAGSWARLRRGEDIRAVLGTRPGARKGRMVVYVRPSGPTTRAAFVAGRTVGGAVVRNRARRMMREAWRELAPRAVAGYDVVFVARPAIRRAKTRDLLPEMEEALTTLEVLAP